MKKKATELIQYYHNLNGPVIGTVTRGIIEKDNLVFKNIDGTGEVTAVNDWRLPPLERAAAYVETLSIEEKIAQLFVSDWRMGKYPAPKGPMNPIGPSDVLLDESGLLDESEFQGRTIFGEQYLPGTTTLIKDWFNRHLILRANPTPNDLVDWLNQLHAVAEECAHFIPVQVVSNSRNENGEAVFGMNDAAGVFAAWPGTLGIAAAVKGTNDFGIVDTFAECVRRSWNACGLKKGYMYMADCMTDPRWQRGYGTFGEDPEFIARVFEHLIPGIQGSKDGVTSDGVSLTVKHFPGGGPRENGFDPHYAMGQWNVYSTHGSLQKYHMKPFRVAVQYNAASIMPYYSKPSAAKSDSQQDCNGQPVDLKPYGYAYNKIFIDGILRGQLGFKGYVNSDTGIIHNMSWGVESLDVPERIGFAITQSGVDLISGLFDNKQAMEAYQRSHNGYYKQHPVPEGYRWEDIVLTDESLDRAVIRTLTELFQQGMFENPYADPQKAAQAVTFSSDWKAASQVHRQSVVLLKNMDVLPLTAEKLENKKVYVEAFHKTKEASDAVTKSLRQMLAGVSLVDDPSGADYALLMINPASGEYFSATLGYLELDICEDKVVCDVDEAGRPTHKRHAETTVSGVKRIKTIAAAVHANGGKVIINVNVTMPWLLGNAEPFADALTVGFDTYPAATLDVWFGRFTPVGRLPITLPRGDSVLTVDANGICISPNDVPGYDKDRYMPDDLKDENGKAYSYRDAVGNYYELGFGLTY